MLRLMYRVFVAICQLFLGWTWSSLLDLQFRNAQKKPNTNYRSTDAERSEMKSRSLDLRDTVMTYFCIFCLYAWRSICILLPTWRLLLYHFHRYRGLPKMKKLQQGNKNDKSRLRDIGHAPSDAPLHFFGLYTWRSILTPNLKSLTLPILQI